ncbi:ribbon-helix-helix protein, CopG family [Agrobacterium rubi]|uniref:ribbon-helix-helix protein, CopG family n=2 Tax=Rhizobiaceae TaxID=82115 RepID=UPI00201B813A|nr:ribbon-helix-helix protein, CopG family [Agrobacterium rubi]
MTFVGSHDAKITRSEMRGCVIHGIAVTTNFMSRNAIPVKEKVAAHRARQLASGRVALNTYVPGELIEAIDQIKEQRGAPSRMPIIEEALRFYIENAPRA